MVIGILKCYHVTAGPSRDSEIYTQKNTI